MVNLRCTNPECKKLLGYDCDENILIFPSSEFKTEKFIESGKVDIKCSRCKRHNIIVYER